MARERRSVHTIIAPISHAWTALQHTPASQSNRSMRYLLCICDPQPPLHPPRSLHVDCSVSLVANDKKLHTHVYNWPLEANLSFCENVCNRRSVQASVPFVFLVWSREMKEKRTLAGSRFWHIKKASSTGKPWPLSWKISRGRSRLGGEIALVSHQSDSTRAVLYLQLNLLTQNVVFCSTENQITKFKQEVALFLHFFTIAKEINKSCKHPGWYLLFVEVFHLLG